MSTVITTQRFSIARVLPVVTAALALLLPMSTHAAAPGITGTGTGTKGAPVFNLTAQEARITQPDGQSIYSWGYGCVAGSAPVFAPATISTSNLTTPCPTMQIPGPTLIVNEGDTVTVTLTNNLPVGAGNTSILFPGFQVTSTGGLAGVLTQEAAPTKQVTYTFTAGSPGTRSYYSGTQGDLQVEMGLYGAIIVLPTKMAASACLSNTANLQAESTWGESDYRLNPSVPAAYDLASSCYDREYLFQFSEIDPRIHSQADTQVAALKTCTTNCVLDVQTEPYHPTYFMVNGRSMPDDMDPNYTVEYPHQPYNGNPHMHPGELVLLRIIGQGRWQHPFHEHGNHVRILARDGNLLLSQADPTKLAGPLLFTTTTTPGVAMDGIFYWTGKGLNWDVYGHHGATNATNPAALACTADANGYNTGDPTALNYYEWCADHNKPLEKAPFGDVGGGGPATLPDPNYLTNGTWYGGSAYLGPNATTRATGPTGTTPPSGTIGNPPSTEAGFAFMWHSHNEREITTNNVFPGGMMMMMLVDSREFVIDESN
jgi:FtsP/CotA-like multicopper oxidase with cupredoxin domain